MSALDKMNKKIAELDREENGGSKTSASPPSKPHSHRGDGLGSSHSRRGLDKTSSSGGGGNDKTGAGASAASDELRTLKEDLRRRQESYVARERSYKLTIDQLKTELREAKSRDAHDDKIKGLRDMHTQVMQNIDNVQGTTSRILQEQERDLLRAFRARLFDVQAELEKEKGRLDDGATQWIEKNRQLEKDLDWAREMADRLQRYNQALTKDNGRLKMQFKTQEDDRQFLINKLVVVKKDNARLQQEMERLRRAKTSNAGAAGAGKNAGKAKTGRGLPRPLSDSLPGVGSDSGSDDRYRNMVRSLKALLEKERRNLKSVRQAYQHEQQRKTELEGFLRTCIQDVQNEIFERRQEFLADSEAAAQGKPRPDRPTKPLRNFSRDERERVMEMLLSQERVISLLYSRTFPPSATRVPGNSRGGAAGAKAGQPVVHNAEEVSALFADKKEMDEAANVPLNGVAVL